MHLRIAVISDLHIGPGNRTPELNPFALPGTASDGFKDAFHTLIEEQKISADFLIVPGDIADRGHPNEYRLAAEMIQFVADELGVRDDRIVIGLGNHDVNWPLSSALVDDTTELSSELRFAPVLHEPWFREKIESGTGSLVQEPFYKISNYSRVLVVCYNSACTDTHNSKPHHGAALQHHLVNLRADLEAISTQAFDLRVFVTHHHPVIYSDPRPDQPDFSAMVNAENLLSLIRDFRFDLLIHGHKHSPRFAVYEVNHGHPLAILCAGSFSKSLDTSWAGIVANQFHLFEISGRDAQADQIFGRLRSWAYRYRAWVESTKAYHGIRHTSPFGYSEKPIDLRARLEVALDHRLTSVGHLKWEDFIGFEPRLAHMPIDGLIDMIRKYANDRGCTLHWTETDDLERLILIRV